MRGLRGLRRGLSDAGAGMGAHARQMAEERYSIRAIADRHEALYARLLEDRTWSGVATPGKTPP